MLNVLVAHIPNLLLLEHDVYVLHCSSRHLEKVCHHSNEVENARSFYVHATHGLLFLIFSSSSSYVSDHHKKKPHKNQKTTQKSENHIETHGLYFEL
jgi:hypothetical protein